MPTLKNLSAEIRSSDQGTTFAISMSSVRAGLEERLDFTFTDRAPGRMSREEMLLHVITHGVGHRGQVSALALLNDLPAGTGRAHDLPSRG